MLFRRSPVTTLSVPYQTWRRSLREFALIYILMMCDCFAVLILDDTNTPSNEEQRSNVTQRRQEAVSRALPTHEIVANSAAKQRTYHQELTDPTRDSSSSGRPPFPMRSGHTHEHKSIAERRENRIATSPWRAPRNDASRPLSGLSIRPTRRYVSLRGRKVVKPSGFPIPAFGRDVNDKMKNMSSRLADAAIRSPNSHSWKTMISLLNALTAESKKRLP